MRKTAFVIFIVLSLGFLGCASRQQTRPPRSSRLVQADRITTETLIHEEDNGRIVEINFFINDIFMMTYEYFDGDIREELEEMSGVPLRAQVAILYETMILTYWLDDDNIIRGYGVFGSELIGVECSSLAEATRQCKAEQRYWLSMYERFEIERRVAESLGR